MFPVNPNADTFDGEPCYSDLQSIPGGVDGVVIVTRPELTEQIVRQCAEAGRVPGLDASLAGVYWHQRVGPGRSILPGKQHHRHPRRLPHDVLRAGRFWA